MSEFKRETRSTSKSDVFLMLDERKKAVKVNSNFEQIKTWRERKMEELQDGSIVSSCECKLTYVAIFMLLIAYMLH